MNMEGIHILQVDDKIIEAIQVDAHGGEKVLHHETFKHSTAKMTAHRIEWRWRLKEKINEALL